MLVLLAGEERLRQLVRARGVARILLPQGAGERVAAGAEQRKRLRQILAPAPLDEVSGGRLEAI